MTTQERITALNKVVEFAKQNGFPEAETLFWDCENPECGVIGISEAMAYVDFKTDYIFDLGICLSESISLRKQWPDDEDKDSIIACSDTGIEVEE